MKKLLTAENVLEISKNNLKQNQLLQQLNASIQY